MKKRGIKLSALWRLALGHWRLAVSSPVSKTFPGIAKAMSEQWGKYLIDNLHK